MENELSQDYWNTQYINNTIGWDLGEVSPPIKHFIDKLADKSIRILIPGCGNAYEAAYLLEKGFTSVTLVDIAPTLVKKLQKTYQSNPNIKILRIDFFELIGSFDLIIEQTFFCALDPKLRQNYVRKIHSLLVNGGRLVGLLFNRSFTKNPPFGGNTEEYEKLFNDYFLMQPFKICTNSIAPRANFEVFLDAQKR